MPKINSKLWMPEVPIDVFFFDWDSTLTHIEGIDFLATLNDVAEEVHGITQRCMAKTGLTLEDYRKRLNFIKPTTVHIEQLAKEYSAQLVPGARETLNLLQSLGKTIYILSGGIKSAIVPFAENLGINPECILAVDLYFNQEGAYNGFDELSDLIQPYGKLKQIKKVLHGNERSLLLGDGYSDWEAKSAVNRFIGYAGFNPKKWVREHSDFYIDQPSILPLLALGLTKDEQFALNEKYKAYYEQGVADLENGFVLIKEYNNVHHTNS